MRRTEVKRRRVGGGGPCPVVLPCLVRCSGGRIAQRNQLPHRERFPRKLRIGVDDKHIAAENATDDKALTLNGDHFVFFVEDRHSYFDAEYRT